MYRLLILTFLFVFANASSILNISYFPLNDKVDILFSLDKPFDGKVIFIANNNYKITNVNLNRIEHKKIKNSLDITISPLDENSISLKLNYKKPLTIKPSVTTKGYGLRIRILGLEVQNSSPLIKSLSSQQIDGLNKNRDENKSLIDNNESSFNYVSYIIVILFLILLIVVLFYVKKKTEEKLPLSLKKDNYKVLYQKMLDPKNRIVMIELFDKRYLLLLGDKNNLLLDKFSEEAQEELKDVSSQNEFGKLLDEKFDEEAKLNFLKNASKLKENDEL